MQMKQVSSLSSRLSWDPIFKEKKIVSRWDYPACNEFCYTVRLAFTRFLFMKIIDCNIKKFCYNEQFFGIFWYVVSGPSVFSLSKKSAMWHFYDVFFS